MLPQEHLEKMLAMIRRDHSCSYTQMAKELHISLSTARRDALELVRQGFAEKVYGGIMILGTGVNTLPANERKKTNVEAKRAAAAKACDVIHDNMSILLYSSSTILQLVPFLNRYKGLKVLTNSVEICEQLTEMGVETYCTGGQLRLTDMGFFGSVCEEMVIRFHPQCFFFSPTAISSDGEIMTYREGGQRFIRLAMEKCDATYCICDSSKLDRSEFFSICGAEDVNGIFCDQPLPEELAARVGRHRK